MHAIHFIWTTRPIHWAIQVMDEKKLAKQNSKNKSKDEENIHLFQNKILTMDEGHLELKLGIKIIMSIQT